MCYNLFSCSDHDFCVCLFLPLWDTSCPICPHIFEVNSPKFPKNFGAIVCRCGGILSGCEGSNQRRGSKHIGKEYTRKELPSQTLFPPFLLLEMSSGKRPLSFWCLLQKPQWNFSPCPFLCLSHRLSDWPSYFISWTSGAESCRPARTWT